jgi:hypothetical protein
MDTFESSEISGNFLIVMRGKMENVRRTDHVKNEVLHIVKHERSTVHSIKIMKTNWIGRILCSSCLLKHGVEGKVERRTDGKTRKKTKQLIGVHKKTEDTRN